MNAAAPCIFAILYFAFSVSSAMGNSVEQVIKDLPEQYAGKGSKALKAVEKYRTNEDAAKKSLRADLDTLKRRANLNNNPLGAADLLRQIQALDAWLINGGELPKKTDFLLSYLYEYITNLQKAKSSIFKPVNDLCAKLRKDELTKEADHLEKEFGELGGVLDGSKVLVQGRSFGGERCEEKAINPVRIEIKIEEVQGNSFSGKIERDTGIAKHPVHGMHGQFAGLEVKFQTQASRIPGNKKDGEFGYCGLVIGNSIIGNYFGKNGKKNETGGFFRLDRI